MGKITRYYSTLFTIVFASEKVSENMGRPKSKSYEEQLKEKYGDKIKNLEPYINLNTKILHRCNYHNYEYYSTPSSVLNSQHGCPMCGKEKHKEHARARMAYTDKEYKEELQKRFDGNIICLEEMQGMNHSILHKCIKHNYEYYSSPSSTLYASCGCRYCGSESTKIKEQTDFVDFNKRVIEYSNGKYEACDYNGYNKISKFKHILENGECHIFEMTPSAFFRGGKCYCENDHINKLIVGYNDIATKRPDVVSWLHNKENASKHTCSEKTKIYWNCPNCGNLLYKPISDVCYKGLSCPFCSDGISYPNKFIYHILKSVEGSLSCLKREYSPKWCRFTINNKKKNGIYDIYFETHNKKYIIEMDGGFHNKPFSTSSDLSLNDIQYIDKEKDRLAIDNDIHIIRIDCDYGSTNRYQYILNSILKSKLPNIIDLSNVDFDECNRKSIGSLIMDTIDLWNKGYGTRKIREELNIGETTVREYLRQGVESGLCDYTPEEGKRRGYYKPVYCKELHKVFESVTEANRITGLDRKYISLCCRGDRDYYGELNGVKLHWEYYKEESVA